MSAWTSWCPCQTDPHGYLLAAPHAGMRARPCPGGVGRNFPAPPRPGRNSPSGHTWRIFRLVQSNQQHCWQAQLAHIPYLEGVEMADAVHTRFATSRVRHSTQHSRHGAGHVMLRQSVRSCNFLQACRPVTSCLTSTARVVPVLPTPEQPLFGSANERMTPYGRVSSPA